MKFILSTLILGLSHTSGLAQSHFQNEWTEKMDQFTSGYSVLNPAACSAEAPTEARLSYKGHTGIFSGIRSFYLQLNHDLKGDSSNGKYKQVLGLTVVGNREGEFITKSKVGVLYGFHTHLVRDWSLAAGTQLQWISYSFQSSTASAGGSANKASASIGLFAYNRQYRIGLQINDLNNPALQPLDQRFTLHRTTMMFAEKRMRIHASFEFIASASVYTETFGTFRSMYASVFEYHKRIGVGAVYSKFNGASALLSLRDLGTKTHRVSVVCSGKIPVSRIGTLRQTSFEVNFLYRIK